MFCDKCGKKLIKNSFFCDGCGTSLTVFPKRKLSTIKYFKKVGIFILSKNHLFRSRKFIISLLVIILIGGIFLGYGLYIKIQYSLQKTASELQKTQSELFLLRTSTANVISSQQESIKDQEKELTEKERALEESKANEILMQKTVKSIQQKIDNVENSKKISQSETNKTNIPLDDIASSIVSLYCLTDSYSDNIQQGSGVLYRAYSSSSDLAPYYVQTSLHVVQTRDGSFSRCLIVLYPNYKNSNVYLLFESENYRFYRDDIDIAFLKPRVIENESWAGSINDLAIFAQDENKGPRCNSVNIGDHLTVLGYPGIGGQTLTVTDGIVSGFEFFGGIRYIKTSAKIEHGNSGGIVIKDSGCVLGIPTFVQTGEIESIGRIIDFGYLFNEILK